MADQGFNKIFVLIAMCLYIQLDVVLLTDSDGITYYFEMNSVGDLGILAQYTQDTSLMVGVFFDAQSDSAKNFFGKQLTLDLIKNAMKCTGVKFTFSPCSVLKDNTPNEANMIQVCVADTLPKKGDPIPFGQFIICYLAGKQVDDCLNQINMDKNYINTCVASQSASQTCRVCHENFGLAKNGNPEKFNAIEGFKAALCKIVGTSALKCTDLCGKT